jgi:D-xylose reductase
MATTTESIQLKNGGALPAVGFGLWKVEQEKTASMVEAAAAAGYRHFDCACDYGNEAEVGVGLQSLMKKGACRRDDLWITSKLWNTYHAAEHVRPALERTLRDLQLDYLDLYLIHFPIAQKFVPFETRYPPGWFYDPDAKQPYMELERVPIKETWLEMERLKRAGLVKHIGVCNFNTALLQDLLNWAAISPAVLQVEMHPHLTQSRLLRFCQERDIAVTAFSPLGAASYFSIGMADRGESVLEQTAVRQIAERHGRSPAQIVLRWGVQRGTAVIPKTSRPERLRENLSIFDFSLTVEEMAAIDALNRNRRFNDPGDFCERAFNTFCPIYD